MTAATDGFRLAYDRRGRGTRSVVLLHGWPGDSGDFRRVMPLLVDELDVVAPDLRGFGASDKHAVAPADGYSLAAQARSVVVLLEETQLRRPILAGYDIGSRIAQAVARQRPDLVGGLVLSPPLPGIGDRILQPEPQREFWYQAFHQLSLAEELIDGRPDAVAAYLRHFWNHWSGPGFRIADADLQRLVERYAVPGAFTASIAWYRAGAGAVAASLSERPPPASERLTTPTVVLWPDQDPLFPRAWSDRIGEFFSAARLEHLDGVGHFTPLEAPERVATAVLAAAGLPR